MVVLTVVLTNRCDPGVVIFTVVNEDEPPEATVAAVVMALCELPRVPSTTSA
jgi:hypothetical protein